MQIERGVMDITALGPGKRFAVWVNGCKRRCPGCISQRLQAEAPQNECDLEEFLRDFPLSRADGATVSGGEPFDQPAELNKLTRLLNERGVDDILVYTGYTLEQLRATKAGLYNPVEHEYAREVFKQAKRYFTELLREGWMSTDYTPMWNNGQVALYEEGLWALSAQYNNTARDFEFGVFPAPLVDKNTTPYSVDIEYTENGPYQPEGDLILNIMKPAVEGKPELEAAAVKFLKYLTTPENISMIAEEMGSVLGSVKGSTYNSILDDWLNQSFPIVPDTNWPLAFNSDQNDRLNRLFGEWVLGSHSDSEFFEQVNSIQQAGADAYIQALNIDTSGWN